MARVGETVSVIYVKNQDFGGGMWYVQDQYKDIIGDHNTKKQAVTAAKRFTKDRATATGVKARLEIKKKDGSLSKVHTYEPEY